MKWTFVSCWSFFYVTGDTKSVTKIQISNIFVCVTNNTIKCYRNSLETGIYLTIAQILLNLISNNFHDLVQFLIVSRSQLCCSED